MSKVRHQHHNGVLNGSHWLSLSSSAIIPGLQIDDVQEQDIGADKFAAAAATVPTSSLVPPSSEGSTLKSGIVTEREGKDIDAVLSTLQISTKDGVLSPTDIDAVLSTRLVHGPVLCSGFQEFSLSICHT